MIDWIVQNEILVGVFLAICAGIVYRWRFKKRLNEAKYALLMAKAANRIEVAMRKGMLSEGDFLHDALYKFIPATLYCRPRFPFTWLPFRGEPARIASNQLKEQLSGAPLPVREGFQEYFGAYAHRCRYGRPFSWALYKIWLALILVILCVALIFLKLSEFFQKVVPAQIVWFANSISSLKASQAEYRRIYANPKESGQFLYGLDQRHC